MVVNVLDENFTNQMILEFDLDIERIPLGKLSEKQLSNEISGHIEGPRTD